MSTGIGSEVFMGLFGGDKGRENSYYLDKMLPYTDIGRIHFLATMMLVMIWYCC